MPTEQRRTLLEKIEGLSPSWGLLARMAFVTSAIMRLADLASLDIFMMLGFAVFAAVLSLQEGRP